MRALVLSAAAVLALAHAIEAQTLPVRCIKVLAMHCLPAYLLLSNVSVRPYTCSNGAGFVLGVVHLSPIQDRHAEFRFTIVRLWHVYRLECTLSCLAFQ